MFQPSPQPWPAASAARPGTTSSYVGVLVALHIGRSWRVIRRALERVLSGEVVDADNESR